MAVAFYDTKIISLDAGPVNLSDDSDIAARDTEATMGFCYIQNITDEAIYWRESPDAPGDSDPGHSIAAGAGIIAQVFRTTPFWVWGTGQIAVSPRAPNPVRTA